MIGLAYLTGRAFGAALSPLAPALDALLEGLLDSVFGEPDEMDVTYTPIPDPNLNPTLYVDPEPYDGPWVLDEERLHQIAGTA